MFDSLSRSAQRQQEQITSPLEHLDFAWRTMRAGTRASDLSSSAQGLIKRLPQVAKDRLWWNDALSDRSNTDAIFERLSETNLFLIYQGRTPTGETRPYLFGDAEGGTLWGVLFVLGEIVSERDSILEPVYSLYLARPEGRDGQSWWDWQEVPTSFVEALVRLSGASDVAGSSSVLDEDPAPPA